MASLNTLRTRFGIVLSVIIALALLAFILSLKTEMGFSGQDPKVGVIAGEKINYSEYYEEYERVKAQSGAQESLLVELGPGQLRLGIGLGLQEELTHGLHVVAARAGVGESVVEGLREVLAADDRQTLGVTHLEAQLLQTGGDDVAVEERLPRGIGQHGRLLLVARLSAALRLDALVLLVVPVYATNDN